jgi:mediator of replication checkpoint protein 1
MSSAKSKENMEQEGPRKEQLLQLKLQLLEKRANAAADDSSDDGLEVEPPTKLEQQRKSAEKKKMSHGKRMILSHARVQTKRPVSGSGKASKDGLEAQAAMLKHGTTDPGALTTWLRDKVEKESRMIVKQKEETWVRLGGAVKEQEASGPTDNVTRNQIQKGFEEWSKPDRKIRIEVEEVDEDEEEDPDWMSDASPSMSPKQEEEIDYEKMEMGEMSDDEPKEQDNGANSNPSQSDNARAIKVKSRHRPRTRVVDSDESDSGEYNDDNVAIPNPRDNRYVVSSSDDRTEDENDKENNTRLMFDRSEDKENKAVARHEPQSIFDAIDHDRSLSPPFDPTLEPEPEAQSLSQTAANPNDKRKPFGVISDASPLSLQRQPSTLTQAFAAQLKHSSPTRVPIEDAEEGDVFGPIPSTPGASLDFAPLFGGGDAGKDKRAAPLGFPQHSQDGLGSSSMGFGAPALLKPGFSDLFESSTQKEDVSY